MKTIPWRLAAAFVVSAIAVPTAAHAQSKWLTTIDLGTGSRLGSVPSGYSAASSNWDGYLVLGRHVKRDMWITASAGMALQEFLVATPTDSSHGSTFDFHSYVLSAGPTFVTRPWYGFVALGSVQPAMVVSFWSLGGLGDCSLQCAESTAQPRSHQTELKPAVAFNMMVGYQLVKGGDGQRPWALGLQLRGLAAPVHARSGIPVSQLGVSLAFILGEP